MTRTASLTKPHLWKGPRQWWCVMAGHFVGSGYTAQEAFRDWVARNVR